jgi:hypothetical protein
MKKLLLSLLVLTSLVSNSYAKRGDYEDDGKKNIVKLNVLGLAASSVGLQYERAFTDKITGAMQARYMFSYSPPTTAGAEFSDLNFNTIAITPEVRYYVRQALKGFYIAPYLRYRRINMGIEASSGTAGASGAVDGKMNTFAGGLMIGAQWRLSNSLSLDWYIAGGHYSSSKVGFDNTFSPALSAADMADLKSTIDEVINGQSLNATYTLTPTSLNLTTSSFGSIGFRGAGLCLGYRF